MKSKTIESTILTEDSVITTMTTTEVTLRHIEFSDIFDSVRVEPDECCDKPWEIQDGYDHEVRSRNSIYESDARGAFFRGWRHRGIIIVDSDRSLYEWYRENGASRGVATEMAALDKRRRLDQLAKWYTDGWSYYYVSCDYLDCYCSVGNVEAVGSAAIQASAEVAVEVAYQLSGKGYIMRGMPGEASKDKACKRNRLRRNLELFSWAET